MVFNLSAENSVASQFLLELRDTSIQVDRARFRKNVERLGQILAYEISRSFNYEPFSITTPLSTTTVNRITSMPVLITILRAGLPFMEGFLNIFDHADCGFVGAYRDETSGEVKINVDYVATPSIKDKELILIDPMLATGKSLARTLELLTKREMPRSVHLASVIAAPEGISHVIEASKSVGCPVRIWTGSIDEKLNDKFYIVPGLGDAGDLSFGSK